MNTLFNYTLENLDIPIAVIISLFGAVIYFKFVRKIILSIANKLENDPNNKLIRYRNKRDISLTVRARKLLYTAIEITGLCGTISFISFFTFAVSGNIETANEIVYLYNFPLILAACLIIGAAIYDLPQQHSTE